MDNKEESTLSVWKHHPRSPRMLRNGVVGIGVAIGWLVVKWIVTWKFWMWLFYPLHLLVRAGLLNMEDHPTTFLLSVIWVAILGFFGGIAASLIIYAIRAVSHGYSEKREVKKVRKPRDNQPR